MHSILYITFDKGNDKVNFLSEKYNLKIVSFDEYKIEKISDLILIDTDCPNLDCFEIAVEITKHKNTPIIFLTKKSDDEDITQYFTFGNDYFVESLNPLDLLHKIKIQINIKDLNFKLDEEILFNELIMESSNNILFIQDNNGIVKANNVFLNFFQISDAEKFNKRHKCISEVFMEYENFYSRYILNNESDWLDKLSNEKKSNEYKILIMDIQTFEPKAFQIHVTALSDSDKFLVTLIDITKITIKSKKFEIQATYDNLTKVFNRTKFNELIEEEFIEWKKTEIPLSFAIFDIDFFKIINDEYGHIVGDETLVTFAQTINNTIRSSDVFARWGGEEFTLLLSNTNLLETYAIVEKLRVMIENIQFKLIGQKTCSIGITQFCENDSVNNVIERADLALYEAKSTGRNKVCIREK
jgi:diguanylate cyclase (GGDEF)-like protein